MQEEFLLNGGIFIFTLIGAVGFGLQAYFTYYFWKKGEEKYFLTFVSYLLATAALVCGMLCAAQLSWGDSVLVFYLTLFSFIGLAIAAAGIQIYRFIRDTWISTEGKA
jgi:hypothetical protein